MGPLQRPQTTRASRRLREHPERVQIGLENGLLLLALVDVLLAQEHHGAQRLGVVSVGFGFPVDIADVVSDRLLLFLQALDAFDEGFELILGEAMGGGGGLIVLNGSGGRHRALLAMAERRKHSKAGGLRSSACALIHSTAQAVVAPARARSKKRSDLVFLACLFERRLLPPGSFLLIFGAPFVVRHAVDDFAALLLRHRHAALVGGILHPVGEAVAAESGEIHEVDVLYVGARAQMLDQSTENGGFEFRPALVLGGHDLLRSYYSRCRSTV